MKRRLIVFLSLLFVTGFTLSPSAKAEDITSHWAYEPMSHLIAKDILKGDAAGNYSPNANVTRAEFATFLVRTLDLQDISATVSFKDVAADAWYYNPVKIASYYGLIKGDKLGNFNPLQTINRQEMAVMIKRSLDYLSIDVATKPIAFADNSKIATWAIIDIQQVTSLGLIVGKTGNNFAPQALTTRAEAATVIYRLLHIDGASSPNPSPSPSAPVVGKQLIGSSYDYNYSDVLTKQAGHSPKADGAGIFTASSSIVNYYLNPATFSQNSPQFYQFLKLSEPVKNLSAAMLNNKILADQGVLKNTADAFIKAGIEKNVNAIYLMSHAIHETGKGTSVLALGIEVGLDANNKTTMVTEQNRTSLSSIKKTYNVYGVGATDANPNKYGSERAYEKGWFTMTDAIIGGADYITERYIVEGQDTLYKMKWDPSNPTRRQYATHVMWAVIQAEKIASLYDLIDADKSTQVVFDVPMYKNQPSPIALPKLEDRYAVNTKVQYDLAHSNTPDLNLRTYPNQWDNTAIIRKLPLHTEFKIIGENGGWYKISVNGTTGWVIDDYVTIGPVVLTPPLPIVQPEIGMPIEPPVQK